jgi:hypothetical protein
MVLPLGLALSCALVAAGCGEVKTYADGGGGDAGVLDGGADIKDAAPDAATDCDELTCSAEAADGCCPAACNAGSDVDCDAVCDNGIQEPGESCDPLETCPGACPQIGCQLRDLDSPGTCQAACVDAGEQTACLSVSDGCCPGVCNEQNDVDCAADCDNGVLETGEQCDPLAECPTSCPQLGCALFDLADPGTCQAQCVAAGTQTACTSGDGCCPGDGFGACNATNDSDCAPACGNGTIESGELCDGNCGDCGVEPYTCFTSTGSAGTCDLQCHVPVQTCGGAADACCSFIQNDTGNCNNSTDGECAGPQWQYLDWYRRADYSQGCDTINVYGLDPYTSYLFTTCSPGGEPIGTGDSVITQVVDNTGRIYEVGNDDCYDPGALPHLAGWSCQSSSGSTHMSCASPSPGGFILPDDGQVFRLSVTICPYGGTSFGTAPFHVWWNGPGFPNAG